MKSANASSTNAPAVPAAAVPATLAGASKGIAERLRNLAERPASLCVRNLIDKYMAVYAGRDVAMMQRLTTWQMVLGDFDLQALDDDVIHAARSELATLPALAYIRIGSRRQAHLPEQEPPSHQNAGDDQPVSCLALRRIHLGDTAAPEPEGLEKSLSRNPAHDRARRPRSLS